MADKRSDTERGARPEGAGGFTPVRGWRASCAVLVALIWFVLDRATKHIVLTAVSRGFTSATLIPGVLDITFARNTGAAFSIGEGHAPAFVALAVVVIAASAVYLVRARVVSRVEVVGLAMVCAGAAGNAIDRVAQGFVTDFFATSFIDFPIFNVADIAIVCGVAVAFIGFVISPANKVDATAELNRRDRASRERRDAKRARKSSRKGA